MPNRYEKLIAVLFFGSTLVSIVKFDLINPPLWVLCAYLYLFKVDPYRGRISKIFTTINFILLLFGYSLLFLQIFSTRIETQLKEGEVFGITINE